MDAEATQQAERRSAVFQAARKIAPLAMGYIPVGMAFGVLAQKAGLSLVNTVLMSVFVYAGSAQLIAVGMFAAGMPPLSIVLTTFVVNLRHLLMSAAMTPYLRKWGALRMAAFCFELTDETFALHSLRFGEGDRDVRQTFYINAMAQTVWVLSSWAGALAGSGVPDVEPLALDYALPAMFIGLLAMQAENGLKWLTAGFTGLVAIGLVQAGLDQWSVIMATVIGATFGAGVETWIRK